MEPGEEYRAPSPRPIAPTREEILVWRISLDPTGEAIRGWERILAPDEAERAGRLVGGPIRTRFIAGRLALRRVLASLLGLAPDRLEFAYGARGKPALGPAHAGSDLRFNLAHSEDLALLAVTRGRRVGIDLEAIRPMPDLGQIVGRFFSEAERSAFNDLPEAARLAAFFLGWTRKEAYLKATGEGLATPLDGFDVSLAPGEPPRLLNVSGRPGEAGRWSLHDLDPASGFAGALAVEGPAGRILWFRADACGSGWLGGETAVDRGGRPW